MTENAKTVRVRIEAKRLLDELSKQEGRKIIEIISDAVEQYRRNRIFKLADDAYATMKKDKDAWEEEQKERQLWDETLMDGLEDY